MDFEKMWDELWTELLSVGNIEATDIMQRIHKEKLEKMKSDFKEKYRT